MIARKALAAKLNKDMKSCGLFIDYENPCLGASSDLIDLIDLIDIQKWSDRN